MTTSTPHPINSSDIEKSRWRIDSARSSLEFYVPHFYGLHTVKGRFERYDGMLWLPRNPAVELTIEAASLDTRNARRDRHLRSADFFDVENHPVVRFVSDTCALDGNRLKVRGRLYAAGETVQLDLDATLRRVGAELDVAATTHVDQRQLGMTWSPLGIVRTPSKLILSGRLVEASE